MHVEFASPPPSAPEAIARTVIEVWQQWQRRRNEALVGRAEDVLIEEKDGEGRVSGRTPHYRIVHLDGPADLVIEVVSESDPGLDYRVKLPRYRQAAIPEIWIVDPFKRSVLVESLGENGYSSRVVSCGRLESAVLAGFWIDVSWLWEEAPPAPLSCIREILG